MHRIGAALLACAHLAACGATGPGTRELTELERNAQIWQAVRPDAYAYAIERICFCGFEAIGPVRVTVQDASVTGRVYVDTGSEVQPPWSDSFPGVDGLFDLLREAYEDGAHRVEVTYDPVLGVPVDFFIDYRENVADEELGVRVTEEVEAI